jgi:hypothetical protein
MKFLITTLLLLSTMSAFADGHFVGGKVSLNGILKSWIMGPSIPLGSITTFYGYESAHIGKGTTLYCISGAGLSTSGGLIGASFGGEVAKVKTVGKCEKPSDYAGGFLTFGISVDAYKSGSRSVEVAGAMSLGFDLKNFNTRMINVFHTYSRSERSMHKRIRDVAWHLAKYSGKASMEKLGPAHLWLKLLLIPFLPASGAAWKSALAQLKISGKEANWLKDRKALLSMKSNFQDLIWKIKRDMDFYQCNGPECEDIFVDTYYFLDAIAESLGECHSFSLSASPTSGLDLKLPIHSKVNVSFSYSYFGIQKTTQEHKSTSLEASKAFAQHNFHKKSVACQKVVDQAAGSFGEFLAILGVKK